MTDYESELDESLLADWCEFCDGAAHFDKYHFSTILMGVFVGDFSPKLDRFLRRFTKGFPASLYENLVRMCSDPPPDRDLLPWVRGDLAQKLKLLGADSQTKRDNIERFLLNNAFTFTSDLDLLSDSAHASRNFDAIYFAEDEHVLGHCRNDAKISVLIEALYHIATNYRLANAIVSLMLNSKIDLGNYFEIYLRGGDYVVGNDSIVVWQYQLNAQND